MPVHWKLIGVSCFYVLSSGAWVGFPSIKHTVLCVLDVVSIGPHGDRICCCHFITNTVGPVGFSEPDSWQ